MALARRLLPERGGAAPSSPACCSRCTRSPTETVDNASFREDSLVTVFTLATLLLSLDRRPRLALVGLRAGPPVEGIGRGRAGAAGDPPAGPLRPRDPRRWGPPEPASPALAGDGWCGAGRRARSPSASSPSSTSAIRFGPMKTPVAYAQYPGGTLRRDADRAAGDLGPRSAPAGLALAALRRLHRLLPVRRQPLGAGAAGDRGRPRLRRVSSSSPSRRGERVVALGLGWFLLALLPVSNLLPIPIPAAERFLYLPLCGIALAPRRPGSAASWRGIPRRPGAGGRSAAWRPAGGLRRAPEPAARRLARRSALWLATVAVNPRSCGAQSAVGGGLLSRGWPPAIPRCCAPRRAREELALRLCSDDSDPFRAAFAYTRLGAARALLDDRAAARLALERATVLHPRYALPFAWLGYLAYQEGDQAVAAMLLKKAIFDLGPPGRDGGRRCTILRRQNLTPQADRNPAYERRGRPLAGAVDRLARFS